MIYPTVSLNGQPAHLRKDSTPGFVTVWPGTPCPGGWRGPVLRSLDRLTVHEAEARWPVATRTLFGGRAGQ